MMKIDEFHRAADELGVGFDGFLRLVNPPLMGARLIEDAKHLARLLQKQSEELKRTAALDVVARAFRLSALA